MLLCSQASQKFLECIAAQQEWHQVHHLCYWELMWSYSYQQNWLEAYHYADLLCKESKWSQVQTSELPLHFPLLSPIIVLCEC